MFVNETVLLGDVISLSYLVDIHAVVTDLDAFDSDRTANMTFVLVSDTLLLEMDYHPKPHR